MEKRTGISKKFSKIFSPAAPAGVSLISAWSVEPVFDRRQWLSRFPQIFSYMERRLTLPA